MSSASYQQTLSDWFKGHVFLGTLYVSPCAPPSSIWGIDYAQESIPREKSPQERALDDFIAKRKARREAPVPVDISDDMNRRVKERNDGEALGRALSKAYVHHTPAPNRIMPWKGGVL